MPQWYPILTSHNGVHMHCTDTNGISRWSRLKTLSRVKYLIQYVAQNNSLNVPGAKTVAGGRKSRHPLHQTWERKSATYCALQCETLDYDRREQNVTLYASFYSLLSYYENSKTVELVFRAWCWILTDLIRSNASLLRQTLLSSDFNT